MRLKSSGEVSTTNEPLCNMLNPSEAVTTILDSVGPGAVEEAPLLDSLGRVLAIDVFSPIDIPQRNNSAMDGYAVRGADVIGKCPITLNVIEHIAAGATPSKTVGSGECSRIFTGAPIPPGSDGVIRQEHTTAISETVVQIEEDTDALGHIRRRGEDIAKGSLVVAKGTELEPAHLGLLASVAESHVPVYRKPRIAVMTSGDEIADLDERESILDGSKIGSSNTYTLLSAVQLAGGIPVPLGIAKDDPADIRERLRSAPTVDLFVTSGGVSVGDHDHLRKVFEDLGGELRFWRIKMRPGKPVAFGVIHGTPWIGLPGNPVSTMVTFELLVRPAIRKMLGLSRLYRRPVTVRVSEAFVSNTSRRDFVRAIVDTSSGDLTASITGAQGSGILTSMAKCNALLIIPGAVKDVPAGTTVQAILLDDTMHVEAPPY
jgi:molybdopterin molybdotransferase